MQKFAIRSDAVLVASAVVTTVLLRGRGHFMHFEDGLNRSFVHEDAASLPT